MDDNSIVTWDRVLCRTVIDRLKDGLPPPPETIETLSVGYESHLEQAKIGLKRARSGGYDVLLLEGRYGIGKSHLLSIIEVIARQQEFVVKRVEIGKDQVYLNSPRQLFKQILCGEPEPERWEYYSHGPYYNDDVREFVGGLRILCARHCKNSSPGVVLLFDELEGTFGRDKLPQFPSRAKVYRMLNVLFNGASQDIWGRWDWSYRPRTLSHLYVVLALTPGVLESAQNEIGTWYFGNPAKTWVLPTRREIRPLEYPSALKLTKRVRIVHSKAFDWQASEFIPDAQLEQLCQDWCALGETRDDRQLVKQVVELLEVTEQNR